MICRPATPEDARDVWAWRNDALTRAMSRTADEIEWPAHEAWFLRALADPAITLLIGEAGGEKVGMVRFDHGAETEVSINVNPALRGRGYGLALLVQGVTRVGGKIFAEIKDENLASRRMFERAGFRLIATHGGRGRYCRPGD